MSSIESSAVRRTKREFKHALIQLIKEQGFHHVTVKDIVERAEYNRTTFYLYFKDKYELADELLREKLEGLEQAVGRAYYNGQLVHTKEMGKESFALLSYIKNEKNFFSLLFVPDTLPDLVHAFPLTIESIYEKQFTFKTLNDIPVNMVIFKRYMANGLYGLIKEWIASDYEKDEAQFIDELIALTRTHIASYTFHGLPKSN